MLLYKATNCLSETWPPQKYDRFQLKSSCSPSPSIASAHEIKSILVLMSSNKKILQSCVLYTAAPCINPGPTSVLKGSYSKFYLELAIMFQ